MATLFTTNYSLNSTNLDGILSIIIITFLACVFTFYYWLRTRKRTASTRNSGFVLLVDLILTGLERMVVNALGKRFRFLTPYAFFLLAYINLGNLISFFGFQSPLNFLVVPLSLGLITFLGIHIFGLFFRKWAYLKRFLNPLELISQFAPFISISFRIFGNSLAGFVIMFLLYDSLGQLVSELKYFNLFAIVTVPFHFYFDAFSGFIQSFIFIMLTFTYWSLSKTTVASSFENNQAKPQVKLYNQGLTVKTVK